MRLRAAFLMVGLVSALPTFGAYVYDFTQPSIFYGHLYDGYSQWTQNGYLGSPYASFAGAGGSMIWNATVTGTNSNDYEINTPVTTANGGGTFIHFVRASLDAQAFSGSCAGSYISVELAVTGITHTGPVAPATLNVNQCSSGSLSSLASAAVSFQDGSTIRTVVWGTTLWVFLDDQQAWAGSIPSTTGHPGIGGHGVGAGNFLSASIGHHDTVAPNTISATGVRSSSLPTNVSLAWDGVSDDSNGIGVYGYCVARGSTTTPCSGLSASTLVPAGATFADASVSAGTSYTYSIAALDFHGNAGSAASVGVTTPPSTAVDPRRVGVFKTGSYWGGGGEQIDTLSGNLNFSVPVVTAQGRTGWSVPVGLSYNSQNWRQDSGTNWNLGTDVGFGYGWRMQIGSITPYYNVGWTSGVNHYTFTDSTGAEYRLDQQSGTVWSSTQGIYVWFDSSTNILHFNNGMFWVMGSVSAGNEQDAGSLYPTIIEDVNGNQVIVAYAGSPSVASSTNTSARISFIEDVRAVYAGSSSIPPYITYEFVYSNLHTGDPFPHLGGVSNWIGTGETYGFAYSTVSTEPPFGTDPSYSGQSTNELTSVGVISSGSGSYSLAYDSAGAGELMQATFPWGGHLRWTYTTVNYAGSRLFREIQNRYLAADSAGSTEWTYPFTHSDSGTTIATVHADTTLADASGVGAKKWTFNTSATTWASTGSWPTSWQIGLAKEFTQLTSATGTALTDDTYTWTQNATSGIPYISTKTSAKDPGTLSAVSAETTQTTDQFGNVTQVVVYPYNNTTTPLTTYNSSYLGGSYISSYIRNRLSSATVTVSAGTKTLVTNYYDTATLPTSNPCTTYTGGGSTYGAGEYDSAPPVPATQRGLLILTVNPAKSTCVQYDAFGGVGQSEGSDGSKTTATPAYDTNYATPDSITTESYNNSLSYNAWLGITQTTGANGETMYMSYDSYGRPATATSPYSTYGSPTEYYSYSAIYALPAQQMKTGADGSTTTTLDGLGRPILVQRGGAAPSKADTVYAPCACSPLGKIQKGSQPYAPGATEYWTTYSYDGIGRTLTVQQPDGASTTHYSYSGATTTVTDPAGNTKQFTTDVLGNLMAVVEPDPCVTSNSLTTSYTYDWMNHLSGVSMTRPNTSYSGSTCSESGTTTQTRTFVYNDAGELTSATNPENGTVSYTYNADTTLATKTDAKGQEVVYTYDSTSKKLTEVQWYPLGTGHAEDQCQRVTYTYGTDSTSYNYGRLLTTNYGSWSGTYYDPDGNYGTCVPGAYATKYAESYTYHPAGAITGKSLEVTRAMTDDDGDGVTDSAVLPVTYSYDTAGRPSTVTYPTTFTGCYGPGCSPMTFTYSYDSMGRPEQLEDNSVDFGGFDNTLWVQGVTYDAGGRITGLQRYLTTTDWDCGGDYADWSITEGRTYNVNGQLASKSFSSSVQNCHVWTNQSGGFAYTYSSTANNGQIQQVDDTMSGETVVYAYDSLKRLTQAASTPNAGTTPTAWTQKFQYDGFGNLTAKVLNGTTSSIGITAGTNQLSGSGYDLNGNMLTGMGATLTYDEVNRVASATPISGGTEYYGYGADNKRIYRHPAAGTDEFTFFGGMGEKLGTFYWYDPTGTGDCGIHGCYLVANASNVWFAGMLIWDGSAGAYGPQAPYQDQVGTNRENGARFYPYGEEIAGTANNHVKFATYNRDGFTGIDYANQRYYASTYGRFTSVDKGASVYLNDPNSWNRYSYVSGDPINKSDPSGLIEFATFCDGDDDNCSGYGGGEGSGFSIFGPSAEDCIGDPDACESFDSGFGIYYDQPPGGTGGSGSGGGSSPPPCGPSYEVSFITSNWASAASVADPYSQNTGEQYVLTSAFIMWSANESGWGQNAQNIAENNYFGAQDKPNKAGWWNGTTIQCNRNGNPIPVNSQNACFQAGLSWGAELSAILGTKSGSTGVTYGGALSASLAASPAEGAAAALQAIANNGYNGPGYGNKVASQSAQSVIDCLDKQGVIH